MTTTTITSADATPIRCWSAGRGRPIVAVHGASTDHTTWRFVGPLLEQRFTVHAVDRRGRGGSGDAGRYALEREFEDVAAVVRTVADRAGRAVDLLGHSFGALAALGAARLAGDHVRRLVLYEPADLGPAPAADRDLASRLEALAAAGEREALLDVFYREAVGMAPADLDDLRAQPIWPARVAAAHTIAREIWAELRFEPDPSWFEAVKMPTLLLLGGRSPAAVAAATEHLRAALPDARVAVMPGQGHVAILTAPKLVADLVAEFLLD